MAIVVKGEREREGEKKKKETREREKKRCSRFFYVCAVIALTPISISQKSVNTHTHAR
jgi:hypothetical protein